jgi:undecaprenyl-phosphate galactose phosphotransferase
MRTAKKILALAILAISDAIVVILCYFLAHFLRDRALPLFVSFPGPLMPFNYLISRYYILFAYIIAFAYDGLYTQRFTLWEETRRLWRGSFIATALTIIAIYVTRSYSVSRVVVVLAFILSLVLLPLARNFVKRLLRKAKLWTKTVLIIGDDQTAQVLRKEIERNQNLGYEIINQQNLDISNKDWLETNRRSVAEAIEHRRPEGVIVSASAIPKESISEIYRLVEGKSEEFIIVPDIAELQNVGVEIAQLESLLLMKFRYNLLQPANFILKRIIELVLTVFAFVLFIPFYLLMAIVIKLTSPGPVLFKQERIGRAQKLFNCLKFRTMYLDADARLDAVLKTKSVSRKEWNKFMKLKGKDPRVTPIGRFLRRFSLDELPQLLNVLWGDMNLVGPRPYLPRESEKIGRYINIITKVTPGMTGLWQVSGRSELPFDERLLLDEYYVKNWSLWIDFVIILRTFGVVLKGKGAY